MMGKKQAYRQDSPEVVRAGLEDWILTYVSAIILFYAFFGTAAILVWPADWPIDVWTFLAGVSTSTLVALFAGVVTIIISWRSSQHFGDESRQHFSAHIRDSIAGTLHSEKRVSDALYDLVTEANRIEDAILILMLDPLLCKELSDDMAKALEARFRRNERTLLLLELPNLQQNGASPSCMPLIQQIAPIVQETEYLQSFSTRRASIIPLSMIEETTGILLLLGDENKYDPWNVVWCSPRPPVIGLRSVIDSRLAMNALIRMCRLIQEPRDTYCSAWLEPDDFLMGNITGIPVTRSIITTQILWDAQSRKAPAGETGIYDLHVATPADQTPRSVFRYAGDQFFPPVYSSRNHSGSLIGRLLANGAICVKGKTVCEVGCGPGYVTRVLAQSSGVERVIAIDSSERAVDVAKENVRQLGDAADRVEFQVLDSGALELESNKNRVCILEHQVYTHWIDVFFIELPLLPYRGSRVLSDYELAYLEPGEYADTQLLPGSVERLLINLSDAIQGTTTQIVLPICASDISEFNRVKDAALHLLGDGIQAETLEWNEDGFLHCVLFQWSQDGATPS